MLLDPIALSERLRAALEPLHFAAPVTHVYNPLHYAWAPHRAYLDLYAKTRQREVLLVGMNPGPWGMAQTGVPFGEIALVRDWLGLQAPVQKPSDEHPKRPVQGFDCPKSEVSGRRLWGWARDRFGTAEAFFSRFFVLNYCPLAFFEESGRNRTPDKLPIGERDAVYAACDPYLSGFIEYLQPRFVVGVGAFAETCIRRVLSATGTGQGDMTIGRILHPSPASPRANRGWAPLAEADFAALGVGLPASGGAA